MSNGPRSAYYAQRARDLKHVSVWVTREVSADLEAICEVCGCNKSDLLRYYIEWMIAHGPLPPGFTTQKPEGFQDTEA